jgi:glucose-6-phosphate 1-dehydrogenase
VPFYIRAGKCLPVTATEVIVRFKQPPRETFAEKSQGAANRMRLRLSPEVVIAVGLRVKVAGEQMEGEDAELIVTHQNAQEMSPYERLLGDALNGDASLFAREDEIEAQWRIVDPVLGNATPVHPYEPNSWGPAEADAMIGDSEGWRNPAAVGAPPC